MNSNVWHNKLQVSWHSPERNCVDTYAPIGANLGIFAPVGLTGNLAFDNSGNLYAATNNRVIKFSPTGANLGNFVIGLQVAMGVAFDTAGNLYVADGYNNNVVKFTAAGINTGAFVSVFDPNSIAFDSSGNLYTAGYGAGVANAGTVHKFSPTGADLGDFVSGLSGTTALAFDPDGNLYVSNVGSHTIDKYSASGLHLASFSTGANSPRGLAFGASIVPEPGCIALLAGMSTVGAAFLRRRKQANKTV